MILENLQIGPELAQRSEGKIRGKTKRFGKSHADYWSSRLIKRNYKNSQGIAVELTDWHIRIHYLGRREWFNLGSPNKAIAAAKARDIYLGLLGAGWVATLAKHKPEMEAAESGCTVGEFLDQVKAVSGLKPGTYEIYARKLRTLVAGVFKIDGGHAKHDHVHGGYREWLQRIHSVKLAKLTPEQVNKWKVRKLESASRNPLSHKRACVTVRSILLCSKALFSGEIRKHLTLNLPTPLPFEGIALPEVRRNRYKSEINPALLLQQAKRELADGWQGDGQEAKPNPELFKILLLALGAGLRRDEIDKLQWRQIKWDRNIIRIEVTEHSGTKSAESEADVDVDPGLLEILKGYLPKPGDSCSQFVIESQVKPRPKSFKNHHYRCSRHFKKMIAWLRGKGISARNAVHSLRKEFGSQICLQGGIFAASVALRHSSIAITRDTYVDKKKAVVLEIGKLLSAPKVPAAEQAS